MGFSSLTTQHWLVLAGMGIAMGYFFRKNRPIMFRSCSLCVQLCALTGLGLGAMIAVVYPLAIWGAPAAGLFLGALIGMTLYPFFRETHPPSE